MKIKIILYFLFLLVNLSWANNVLTFEELFTSLKKSAYDFKKEELAYQKAEANYYEQLSFLYPTLVFNLPAKLTYIPLTKTVVSGFTQETENSLYWVFNPIFVLSYMLPTSGTLNLALANNLIINSVGSSTIPGLAGTTYSDSYTLSLNLIQPIFFESAFQASLDIVEKNYELARTKYLVAQNNLIFETLRIFLNLQSLQVRKKIAFLTLEDAKLSLKDVQKKYQIGQANKIALLKAEAYLKKCELDQLEAEAAFKDELLRVLNRYGIESREVVEEKMIELVLPDILHQTELKTVLLQNNYELKIARQTAEISRLRLITLRCENSDTLTLGVDLALKSHNESDKDFWKALSAPFGENSASSWSFNFKLSFKILDGGAFQQKLKAAELDAQTSSLAFENQLNLQLQAFDSLVKQYERSKAYKEYNSILLNVAREEQIKAASDYKLGQISRQEYERSERNILIQELALKEAENNFYLTALKINLMLGRDLIKSLKLNGM